MNKGKKIAGVTRQRVGQLIRTLFQFLLGAIASSIEIMHCVISILEPDAPKA